MIPSDASTPEHNTMADPADDRKPALRRLLPLAVLLVLIGAAWLSGVHRFLTMEQIVANHDWLQRSVAAHFVTSVAAYMAVYFAVTAFSVPGASLLTILGGFLFGWLVCGSATLVGATAGATAVFLIARSSLGELLTRKAGGSLEKLARGFRDDAFHYLLFLRLVPVFPFWLVNIAPALFGVRLRTFVVTTFIGIIPGTFAFAFLGSGLDSIIAEQQRLYEACVAEKGKLACEMSFDPAGLLTNKMLVAFAALGVMALIPVVIRHWRNRQAPPRG